MLAIVTLTGFFLVSLYGIFQASQKPSFSNNTFAIFHSKLTRPPETGFFKKTRFLQLLKGLERSRSARCERAQKPGFSQKPGFLILFMRRHFGEGIV